MTIPDATNHLIEALARVNERTGRQAEQWPAARAFTIALSREVGALGTSVARAAGARLKWPVYDHELLEKVANDMHVHVRVLESLDEKPQSWLQESMAAWSLPSGVSESAYFRRLIKVLISLAAQGECLIVGRGAAQFLPQPSTLRVRFVADRENRIAVIRREKGVSAAEAAGYIETSDRERNRFIKSHFQKDPTDPLNYDLVLNTGRFSVPACAELIVDALRQLQGKG